MERKVNQGGKIPFVRPARVGNFKLWRSKMTDGLEVANISNLDGSWCVRIPSTFEMFGVLSMLYYDIAEGKDADRQRAEGIMSVVLSNMMYCSTIGNGYFQQAMEMIAVCYANPSVLTKKDKAHKDLVKSAKNLIESFLEWRKEYDKKRRESTEEDDKRDDIAEQALDILKEKKDGGEDESDGGDADQV